MNDDENNAIYDTAVVVVVSEISNVTHGTDLIFGELNQNPVRFEIPNLGD
jgi:hypothetical protein